MKTTTFDLLLHVCPCKSINCILNLLPYKFILRIFISRNKIFPYVAIVSYDYGNI